MKKLLSLMLCIALISNPILATAEQDTAVAYLVEHGIYQGDENGNLNLEQGLTRAELAAILTRMDFILYLGDGLKAWDSWGMAMYTSPSNRENTFIDLPSWALPYVEYCYQRRLMNGVRDTSFDPNGKVNPRMVCTVMLRFCGVAETDWSFDTSVAKAQALGIAPSANMSDSTIDRGTMAVIVYNGIQYDMDKKGMATTQPDTSESPTTTVIVTEPATTTPAQTMTIDEMRDEIVRLTNEARAAAGLSQLIVLPELMDCAQAKAEDFIESNYFGHKSPVYGAPGEMIRTFVPNAGYAGENLATWSQTPKEVVDGWMVSQGHRENIMSTIYTHVGVGIIMSSNGGYAWVQHFANLQ